MNDIVERVKGFLAERPDVAPDRFAACTKFAPSTLRHVLDGMREPSADVTAELARVLRLALAGEVFPAGAGAVALPEGHARPILPVRRPRDIFLTETLRKVGRGLTYCAEHAALGVITATYGAGKTMSVRHWREFGEGRGIESVVFEHSDFSASNSIDFVESLADLVGAEYKRGCHNGGRTLRALCALLLARSSWRLWRAAGASAAKRDATSPADVLATSLVNPKGLIFAFAIFPPLANAAQTIEVFVRFGIVALVVMSLWGLAGAVLGQGAAHCVGAAMVDRAGAVVLATFSVVVLAMGLAG